MGARKKIEIKIKKKEKEIQELRAKINDAKIYIQALNDTLKVIPKDKMENTSSVDKLRAGSSVFKTWQYLEKSGKPMHIDDILTAIGKGTTKKDKTALAGSLGYYVRNKEIFTRPAPNTFGLIDIVNNEEPPSGFGDETPKKISPAYNETTDIEPF